MDKKKVFFALFILVAIVQLYVPASMIWDKEEVITTGHEYKFKTAPVDPTDPFRGKYITLRYEQNDVSVENEKDWKRHEKIYVTLRTDFEGFAQIESVAKENTVHRNDFITATVQYVTHDGSNKLTVAYPFDRYYTEESKAYEAELAYRESLKDSSKTTYALVSVKEGKAVLKDVMIDGVSIKEVTKERLSEEINNETEAVQKVVDDID